MFQLIALALLYGCGIEHPEETADCGSGFVRDEAGNCSLDSESGSLGEDTSSASFDDYEGDEPGECTDGADNDRDGKWDCDDPDCAGSPDCAGPEVGGDGVEEDTAASDAAANPCQGATVGSQVGECAPDFTLTGASGDSTHLYDFLGDVVLLDFSGFT